MKSYTLRPDIFTLNFNLLFQVRDESTDNIMGYILSKCRDLVPSFDARQVIHTFSGARAKNTTGDWIIGPAKNTVGGNDVVGFINAASIDSPGIAASPAIAADVVRMLGEEGLLLRKDPDFNPIRAPIVTVKDGYKGPGGVRLRPFFQGEGRRFEHCMQVREGDGARDHRRLPPLPPY